MYWNVIVKQLLDFWNYKDLKEIYTFIDSSWVTLQSITWMQAWLWVPKIEDLDKLVNWCNKNEIELKSITWMQNWIPSYILWK